MDSNICIFVPNNTAYEAIHTFNFVLETKEQTGKLIDTPPLYRINLVTKGNAVITVENKEQTLNEGDVFFTIPTVSYAIKSEIGFEFAYISYLGTRANYLAEKLRITKYNYVFKGFNVLINFWLSSLNKPSAVSDLISESVLLYSFAIIGEKVLPAQNKDTPKTAVLIKKYVDKHFTEPDLSLKKISENLSYNAKYLSATFKQTYKIGLVDYINTLRIQHACNLIEQGLTAVNNVAFLCGFSDALYFSKVFKSKMHVSPKEHVKNIHKSD